MHDCPAAVEQLDCATPSAYDSAIDDIWHCTPKLRAVQSIRKLRGGSQSYLVRCSNHGIYVVKFQGNPQGSLILANEFLGTQLAARLGLPATNAAIVEVGEDLIRSTPDMRFELRRGRNRYPAGLQFGSLTPYSRECSSVYDVVPASQLEAVENFADFMGLLVFDKWCCNTDRRQTIFYRRTASSPIRMQMVDQGFCFDGVNWNFPDAPLRGLARGPLIYRKASGMDSFEPWLSRIENEITESVLLGIAKNIPAEWYGHQTSSFYRLLERLYRRRSRVRELLWITRKEVPAVFPNWEVGSAVGTRDVDWRRAAGAEFVLVRS
jgi:hypothetical protein